MTINVNNSYAQANDGKVYFDNNNYACKVMRTSPTTVPLTGGTIELKVRANYSTVGTGVMFTYSISSPANTYESLEFISSTQIKYQYYSSAGTTLSTTATISNYLGSYHIFSIKHNWSNGLIQIWVDGAMVKNITGGRTGAFSLYGGNNNYAIYTENSKIIKVDYYYLYYNGNSQVVSYDFVSPFPSGWSGCEGGTFITDGQAIIPDPQPPTTQPNQFKGVTGTIGGSTSIANTSRFSNRDSNGNLYWYLSNASFPAGSIFTNVANSRGEYSRTYFYIVESTNAIKIKSIRTWISNFTSNRGYAVVTLGLYTARNSETISPNNPLILTYSSDIIVTSPSNKKVLTVYPNFNVNPNSFTAISVSVNNLISFNASDLCSCTMFSFDAYSPIAIPNMNQVIGKIALTANWTALVRADETNPLPVHTPVTEAEFDIPSTLNILYANMGINPILGNILMFLLVYLVIVIYLMQKIEIGVKDLTIIGSMLLIGFGIGGFMPFWIVIAVSVLAIGLFAYQISRG